MCGQFPLILFCNSILGRFRVFKLSRMVFESFIAKSTRKLFKVKVVQGEHEQTIVLILLLCAGYEYCHNIHNQHT